ncbi:helix-turn-helix transcriptional regulator [Ornithinibacillus xuwenensis]|uniref:Helix-turn-helix transcriptional regulator n=1 Tax=Ornithinibacillus xuwenensis TaxID=3144668 RepID=A0ABU9XBU8_9BACI
MSFLAYKVGRCLLRYRLQQAGMSQQELSEKLGVTKQQINSYVLNKRMMSLRIAKNISSIINCNIEELYEWVEVGD